MSNFKLKRTAEHPNETTTGIISLSEHIADPDAHRVVVNVPTSQQVNLTINDKDELKSLLDSWYAQIGHTHSTSLSPEDIGKIVDSLNDSMLQTLKNYALKNHDHDDRYLKIGDLDTEIESYLSKLNIADTILSELSLNTKLPEQNADTYATRDGVSAYLPGKNIVYVNNLTDFGNYCLTSYEKYPVFTSSVGTATIDKYSVYKDLETDDYVGLDSIVDFTTDFCGLLNVYRTKYTENGETYYLVIQKLSFMQSNGECIEAIRYGTVQGTLSAPPGQTITPDNKESFIECRNVPWNPWKVTNEKPVIPEIPEYSELDITKTPSSELVDQPLSDGTDSSEYNNTINIPNGTKHIVIVVSSTKNMDTKVGSGPYLPVHGWFSINLGGYTPTPENINISFKLRDSSAIFEATDIYSVYYYNE